MFFFFFAVTRFTICALIIQTFINLSYHVLLCYVALHIAVGVLIFKKLREGGVLCVAVQHDHMLVVAPQFGQSHAIRLPRSNLVSQREHEPHRQMQQMN